MTMERIKIAQAIMPGADVWTGINGCYIPAPTDEGTYSLYEIYHYDEEGRGIHDDFEFIEEDPDPNFGKDRYIPEVDDDEGWEYDEEVDGK